MQNLQIPIAIVLAGVIVAGAVAFSSSSKGATTATEHNDGFGNNNSDTAENVRPVDLKRDHVVGNENAKVTIIEYSDFECPFCARFHPTLEKIVEDFGGEVAWVYRHFPLTSIHSKATGAAVASECVAELGGNDAFWDFSAQAFQNQHNLGPEFYTSVASSLGVSETDFSECIDSGRYDKRIQEDLENVVESGGRGTPFSIVINEKGEVFPFSGALPYENVRSIVEQALEG